MNINASFDHRFIDGAHAAQLARTVKEYMENPYANFDALPTPVSKIQAPDKTA
jgi:pyruvate dehydrogenase E2 component (dihydrolipoamide acetyltransferase)